MDRLIVEILDEEGAVKQRHVLRVLPASLGRAYHNDVILDDPWVSPVHAHLTLDGDGGVLLEDAGSRNGVFRLPFGGRVEQTALTSDDCFRIGHTILRLRSAEHPVADALHDHASHDAVSEPVGSNLLLKLLVPAVSLLLFALYGYLGNYEKITVRAIAGPLFFSGAIITGWAGAWALVSRIVAGRFAFGSHLAVACIGFLLATYEDVLEEYFSFSFALPRVAEGVGAVSTAVVIGWVLYRHLSLCSQRPHRLRLALSAGAVASAFVGAVLFMDYAGRSEWDSVLRYPNEIKPTMFRIAAPRSIPELTSEVTTIAAEVTALIDKD